MPQMSPLMWMELFITFSLLLLISMVKIYFTPSDSVSSPEFYHSADNKNLKIKWMW